MLCNKHKDCRLCILTWLSCKVILCQSLPCVAAMSKVEEKHKSSSCSYKRLENLKCSEEEKEYCPCLPLLVQHLQKLGC